MKKGWSFWKYATAVFMVALFFVLSSCVGLLDDNSAPEKPYSPKPENNSVNIGIKNVELSWESYDLDEDDMVYYDVYFGKSESNLEKIASDLMEKKYKLTNTLEYETKYYWQIVAKDDNNASTKGEVWNFTTQKKAVEVVWQKNLGGTDEDQFKDIVITSDGGYVVAGYTYSDDKDITSNHGNDDYWIIKFDANNNVVWQKVLGGSSIDEAYSIKQTNDGGFIIAGETWSSSSGDVSESKKGYSDYWIVKLDSNGNIQWNKVYGSSSFDIPHSIIQTSDGGYMVVGECWKGDGDVTDNNGFADYWILKLDSNGNISWQKSYGGSDSDYAEDVKQTSDGGYIVVGYTYSNDGDVDKKYGSTYYPDAWIIKLDSTGALVWKKTYGGSGSERIYSVLEDVDGGYVIAGSTDSTDEDVSSTNGNADFWVIKLSSDGSLVWEKAYGGSASEKAYKIIQTDDKGYVVTGFSFSFDGDLTDKYGSKDIWTIKLDNSGNLVWQKILGGTDNDGSFAVAHSNEEFIIVGYSESDDEDLNSNYGEEDGWIVKVK